MPPWVVRSSQGSSRSDTLVSFRGLGDGGVESFCGGNVELAPYVHDDNTDEMFDRRVKRLRLVKHSGDRAFSP